MRKRGHRPGVNLDTAVLREDLKRRRLVVAIAARTRRLATKEVIAARLAAADAAREAAQQEREQNPWHHIEAAKQSLDRADELLGVKRQDTPAGAQPGQPEAEAPPQV